MQVLPGLVLGFFEVTVLTSISVAISTRLPMLVNLVVCILIFFLGHLSPVLVEVDRRRAQVNELVSFMARLFAWVLALAGVLQRRPVDLDRGGHSLDRLRPACTGLLRVVQWSSVVVRVPACSRIATWPELHRRGPGCPPAGVPGPDFLRPTRPGGGVAQPPSRRRRSHGLPSRALTRQAARGRFAGPLSGGFTHASRRVSTRTEA